MTGRPAFLYFLYFPIFLSVAIIFLYFDEIPIFSYIIFTPKKCRDTRRRHIKKLCIVLPTCKLLPTPLLVSRSMVLHVLGSLQSLAGTLSDEGWGPRDNKIVLFA